MNKTEPKVKWLIKTRISNLLLSKAHHLCFFLCSYVDNTNSYHNMICLIGPIDNS